MKKPRAFILFILTVVGALSIAGCSSNKETEPLEAASEGSLAQLVEMTRQDEVFVMEGLPWLITKQEVKDSLEQKEIQLEEEDRLVVYGDLSLDDAVEHTVIYYFQEDQLVSGENWFVTTDESSFTEWGGQMHGLVKNFPEPITQNVDVLKQADTSARNKEHIIWEGEDRSNLRLNLSTTEADEFLLQFQVISPLLERLGLR